MQHRSKLRISNLSLVVLLSLELARLSLELIAVAAEPRCRLGNRRQTLMLGPLLYVNFLEKTQRTLHVHSTMATFGIAGEVKHPIIL